MRVKLDQLGNDAHVWVFGISPSLDDAGERLVRSRVEFFLDDWAAHGVPIRGACDVREGTFLIVAADENRKKSGCSIDRMFGTLKDLESQLGVQILDAGRVFLRDPDGVRAVSRNHFRSVANPQSVVFDTTAERLGEIRSGAWERAASESWHSKLL